MLPSKYWAELNKKTLRQIFDSSYEKFKHTVARNHFTFIVRPWNHQIRFLMRSLPFGQAIGISFGSLFALGHGRGCGRERGQDHYGAWLVL